MNKSEDLVETLNDEVCQRLLASSTVTKGMFDEDIRSGVFTKKLLSLMQMVIRRQNNDYNWLLKKENNNG